jgi:hypothetical protein
MNDSDGFIYLQNYFGELFGKRNIDALDKYLDREYFDDDIGDPTVDHIQNSKDYLKELFNTNSTVGVDVIKAIANENVISAFLDWYVLENGEKKVIRKGAVNFVLRGERILKRHTFIYSQ